MNTGIETETTSAHSSDAPSFKTTLLTRRLCLYWTLPALLALSLISCASAVENATDVSQPNKALTLQQQRERILQSTWVGKRYDALLEGFGEPKLHMDILGYRPLKTSLAVYGVVDPTSQCIDAFTMVQLEDTGEWVVADYFCR